MKHENIRKFSSYDAGMLRNIMGMSEMDMKMVMMEKGDFEHPPIYPNIHKVSNIPMGKSMRAADRRKRTYHKHNQRERQYRNLGYSLERFSEADLGKMREGVGMFPETQHQYTMYNRGDKKIEKAITTRQAISMMEQERWMDEQEAIADYEEAERLFMIDEMDSVMQDVHWLDEQIEFAQTHITTLLERVKNLTSSIASMENRKQDYLEAIKKMKEVLNE